MKTQGANLIRVLSKVDVNAAVGLVHQLQGVETTKNR